MQASNGEVCFPRPNGMRKEWLAEFGDRESVLRATSKGGVTLGQGTQPANPSGPHREVVER